ncbi:hypothetical protein LINGRAHAP2_LOCUS25969 [Linum grandiflorum]
MPLLHLHCLPDPLPSSTAPGSPTHSSATSGNLSLPLFLRRRLRRRRRLSSSTSPASAWCGGLTRTAARSDRSSAGSVPRRTSEICRWTASTWTSCRRSCRGLRPLCRWC